MAVLLGTSSALTVIEVSAIVVYLTSFRLPIVLKEYANRYDIPNVPELCEELPQSTTLAQTAAVWKYTATFIVKQNSGQM